MNSQDQNKPIESRNQDNIVEKTPNTEEIHVNNESREKCEKDKNQDKQDYIDKQNDKDIETSENKKESTDEVKKVEVEEEKYDIKVNKEISKIVSKKGSNNSINKEDTLNKKENMIKNENHAYDGDKQDLYSSNQPIQIFNSENKDKIRDENENIKFNKRSSTKRNTKRKSSKIFKDKNDTDTKLSFKKTESREKISDKDTRESFYLKKTISNNQLNPDSINDHNNYYIKSDYKLDSKYRRESVVTYCPDCNKDVSTYVEVHNNIGNDIYYCFMCMFVVTCPYWFCFQCMRNKEMTKCNDYKHVCKECQKAIYLNSSLDTTNIKSIFNNFFSKVTNE